MTLATAVAASFNLVCVGSSFTLATGESPTPFNEIYRIDLGGGAFCSGDCSHVDRISEVQPTALYLLREKNETPTGFTESALSVDRVTGKLTSYSATFNRGDRVPAMLDRVQAVCRSEKFSGFPAIPTKF